MARPVDPRLRVVYLVGVAVGVFFVRSLGLVALFAAAQIALWLLLRQSPRRLLRQMVKLAGFAAFLILSYALTRSEDGGPESWKRIHLFGGMELAVNQVGALTGLMMALRVLVVVLASQIARVGDPRAIAAGLRKLAVPEMVATSIDAVLALLGTGGPGSGSGMGGGGGRGRRSEAQQGEPAGEPRESFWASLKRLSRGDVAPLLGRLERQIKRAEAHLDSGAPSSMSKSTVRDVAVVAGLSLTMLGIKALKILPSIPFAPGHKLIVLTPFYILAAAMTRTPLGSTLTGLTMGTVAFLMGDGRYGIFEICKHVAPGILCDLLVPVLLRLPRQPGPVVWSIFGGLVAAGRLATIFCIVLTVQAPKLAYAFLAPGMAFHVTFGALSGYVSYHLVRGAAHLGVIVVGKEKAA